MSAAPADLARARDAILRATLLHVPFDGWSATSLAAGIRDSGIEGAAARLAKQLDGENPAHQWRRGVERRGGAGGW